MTPIELRNKIKKLIPQVISARKKTEKAAVEYDELTKFPELKSVIVDLLTPDFDSFLASIDWVAPRPTTFRINLKNGQEFYLTYNGRSWIAQVEGKKYYLINLPEEEHAVEAIVRILKYGMKVSKEDEDQDEMGFDSPPEEPVEDAGEEVE
jgi:hypothetical protein